MGGPLLSLIFKINPAFRALQRLCGYNLTPGIILRTCILETLPGEIVPGELECYQELLGQYKAWRSFQIQTLPPTAHQESGKTLIGFSISSKELCALRKHVWDAFYQVAPELEKPRMCRLYVPVCLIDLDPETVFEKIKEQFPSGLKPLRVIGLLLASQHGTRAALNPIEVLFDGKRATKSSAGSILPITHDLDNTELRGPVAPVIRRVMQRSEEPHRNHVEDPWRTGQGSPDSAKPHEEHDIRANVSETAINT